MRRARQEGNGQPLTHLKNGEAVPALKRPLGDFRSPPRHSSLALAPPYQVVGIMSGGGLAAAASLTVRALFTAQTPTIKARRCSWSPLAWLLMSCINAAGKLTVEIAVVQNVHFVDGLHAHGRRLQSSEMTFLSRAGRLNETPPSSRTALPQEQRRPRLL